MFSYVIDLTTPPSTRSAAPFVAEESGLQRKAARAATSAGSAKRCKREVGRTLRKNSASTLLRSAFLSAASLSRKPPTPSEEVGPGNKQFTVTLVPAVVSANPRDTANWAVLVTP